MGETVSATVLGRIAAAGSEDQQARAMTLQKAVRVSLAKAADALMDLQMAVIGSIVQQVQADALNAEIDADSLLLLIDGPTAFGGAVAIDPVLVGGMIQQQTIGTVRPDTGVTRQMTRTDAAICAPFLDALFERASAIVDKVEDARLVTGFRFGAKADHSRSLLMALDAADYCVMRLTLDLARGARQGEMVIILPVQNNFAGTPDPETGDAPVVDAPAPMGQIVMDLNADLEMVLCRLNVPLQLLQNLEVGQVLEVPPGQFPNVQICTKSGKILGQGTVGQVDGLRAIKPKRKPLHATQPLRRVSDEEHVDMPKVEEIVGTQRRATDTDSGEDTGPDRPAADVSPNARPAAADETSVTKTQEEEVVLPALEDFPELSELPNLADLPDLADMPDLDLSIAS